MASTYSALKFELITTGEQSGTWGDTTNTNIGTAIQEAITGSADVTFASGTVTLTLSDTNNTQTARNLRLNLTGTSGGAQNLIVPAIEKQYIVYNGCADTITIKNSTGTGIAVPAGKTMVVFNNGTNVVDVTTHATSLTLASALPVTSGGTGVTTSTGSGNNVLSTSPTLTTPILGTPTSGTLTNCTGLPISTGVSGLGSGVATFLATPSSANLASAVSDETGSGSLVFANTPTLVTPVLGTPGSGTLTNCTGLPLTTGVTGTLPVANGGTGVTTSTGSGSNVLSTSPTLVTPILGTPTSGTLTNCTGLPVSTGVSGLGTGVATALAVNVGSAGAPVVNGGVLGTPSSGTLTNATGLPLTTGVTGTLPVANGGTGATSLTANNVLLGNGTSAVQVVAPGTSGNVLTSNGTTWASTALPTLASGAGTVTNGGTFTFTTGSTGKALLTVQFYTVAYYGGFGTSTGQISISSSVVASQEVRTMEYDGRLSSATGVILYRYSGSANATITVTFDWSGSGNFGNASYMYLGL